MRLPMNSTLYFKRISDPVHGTIGLTEIEAELLSTQACQRLRNVKQLGLAHYVFPGADYSRLSHCIGVCHVTGRILNHLRSFATKSIKDSEYQRYRLAGLLHDIGHYPFSHAFEDAVTTYYATESSGSLLEQNSTIEEESKTYNSDVSDLPVSCPPTHEEVGQLLLEHDREIQEVFKRNHVDPASVSSIFTRKKPYRFSNLISSDLDADRIDYMLRTALHTGIPYGSVDIEYILSQMRLDSSERICLTPKALYAAEHFLLGRYFDYQSTSFHKTVAAFEWVLEDVVKELLKVGILDCSRSSILQMISGGDWHQFDDPYIFQMIRQYDVTFDAKETVKLKIASLLRRTPPKLIGSIEYLASREMVGNHRRDVSSLRKLADQLSVKFDIPRDLWYVWDSKGMSFTKVPSLVPISTLPIYDDDLEQSIRIQNGATSNPIINVARSLMSILAQQSLYTARLYVLFPDGQENQRHKITQVVRQEFDHEHWTDAKVECT